MEDREINDFVGRLGALRRRWQWGLVLERVLCLAGSGLVVLLVYGVLDFFFAWECEILLWLDILVLCAGMLAFMVWLIRILALRDRDMAERADAILRNPRNTVLSGYELGNWMATSKVSNELRAYLIQCSVINAHAELQKLSRSEQFPLAEWKKRARVLLIQALAALMIFSLNGPASVVIVQRILFPLKDIPPYSNLQFTVSPVRPSVVYGGNIEVSVSITGAELRSPVVFEVRHEGKRSGSMCFQEGEGIFAQRMEKVVSPLEFRFRTGKARSRWEKLELILQPQIALGEVTITPPAYCGMPVRRFFLGNEELASLRQSGMQLSLTSNRPLLDGVMKMRNTSGESIGEVTGVRTGPRTVTFEWVLKEAAELEVVVRDPRGVANRDPLKLDQKVREDAVPVVSIREPAGFVMATPSSVVPVEGEAEDDFGLSRVQLVRAVVGYRDRSRTLSPLTSPLRHRYAGKVDLPVLGVRPGDIVEFYLEAMDENPNLTGVGASEIVRINVISGEEYANILRMRTTTEELMQRYHLADEQLTRLEKSLQVLRQVIETKRGDLDKSLSEAQKVAQATEELFRQMGADFLMYEIEVGFAGALNEITAKLKFSLVQFKDMKADDPKLYPLVSNMLSDLEKPAGRMREEVYQADMLATVVNLMEQAVRFRLLLQRQTQLVRRLERCKDGGADELRRLAALGREQAEVRQQLLDWARATVDAAAKLPAEFADFVAEARAFVDRIEGVKVEELMGKSASSAANQDAVESHRYALLALEKMREIVEECKECRGGKEEGEGEGKGKGKGKGNSFGSMAGGDNNSGVPGSGNMADILKQMLDAMAMRLGACDGQGEGAGRGFGGSGRGGGGGAGGGIFGGSGNDGYRGGGFSPLNIPVFGPARSKYGVGSKDGKSGGDGTDGAGGRRVAPDAAETMRVRGTGGLNGEGMQWDDVPEKYREAVKRYFSRE